MSPTPTTALLAHAEYLRSLALSMVGREDLADDLLQDVWVTALASPPRDRWDPRRWLTGVTRNLARQRHRETARRLRRESRAARPEGLPAAGDTAARLDLMTVLVDAVQALDPPYREVVVLRFFDALPPREIARRLGIPVETVRTRQRRALERLRAHLDTTHGDRETWTAALLPLTALPRLPAAAAASASATTATTTLTGTTLLVMNSKLLFAGLVLAAVVLSLVYAFPSVDATSPGVVGQPVATELVAGRPEVPAATPPDSEAPRQAVDADDRMRIHGKVLRNQSEPLSGAQVRIRLWHGYEKEGAPDASSEVLTDAEGRFAWALPHPRRTVTVELSSAPTGRIAATREILVVAGQDPGSVVLACYALDFEVQGRVTDMQDNPIEGALVTLFRETAVTGEDGTYRVRGSTAFSGFGAEVYARGFVLSNQSVQAQSQGVRNVDFKLRRGLTVSGRVTTEDGAPVVGARFYESWRTQDREGITDLDGRYTLTCLTPSQEARLTVIHDDFLSSSAAVKSVNGDPVTQDFVLPRGSTIRGVVVTTDGAPVPGAELELYRDPVDSSPLRTAIARDDGRFEMRGVEPGKKKIVTARRGFAAQATGLVLADGLEVASDVRIELRRGETLRGIVTDPDQKPVAGATLYVVEGRDRSSLASVGRPARSDARGVFRIPDLPPGPVTVRATRRGYLDAYQVVDRTADADLRLTLPPAGKLAGRVIDKATGAPVTDFRVRFVEPRRRDGDREGSGYSASWRSTGKVFSAATGAWDTGGEPLEPGTVFGIEVTAPGFAACVVPRVVVAVDPQPVECALERGRLLEGTVVAAGDNRPIAGAVVRVLTPTISADSRVAATVEDPLRVVTDDRGVFRFAEVPDGALRLAVRHPEWPTHIVGPFEDRRPRRIGLSTGAVIRGVVLSDAGQPVPQARVSIAPTSRDRGADSRSARADAGGKFAFDRLPSGEYDVSWMVFHGNTGVARRSYRVRVAAGDEVEVRMAKPTTGSTVSGQVFAAVKLPPSCYVTLIPRGDARKAGPSVPTSGSPESKSPVTARKSTLGFIEDGRFAIHGVEPGSYVVHVSHLGSGVSVRGTRKEIEVVRGQDVQVDVTVKIIE